MDWIHLSEDMIKWQVLVKMVVNFWSPYKVGNFLIS